MDNENIVFSAPTLSVNLNHIDSSTEYRWRDIHLHNAIEIIRVDRGKIFCYIGKEKITVNAGELLLVNSRVIHKLRSDGGITSMTYLQIDIDSYVQSAITPAEHYLYAFMNDSKIKQHMLFSKSSELAPVFNCIEQELTGRRACYDSYIRAYVMYIVAIMRRNKLFPDYSVTDNKNNLAKIMPAIKFAAENFNTKIYLEDASKSMNMDKFYFCKLFKKTMGSTYVDYVNYLRLDNAENMLVTTDKNISEIAFECGFASVQYFNRLFKNRHNCSPKDYRKMNLTL